jgi:hypothetical protein
MALPVGFDINNPKCPKCAGPCWDNRTSKKNPKSPDWKCKDKNCHSSVWQYAQGEGPAPAPQGQIAVPAAEAPQMQRQRISHDDFVLETLALTEVLMTGLMKTCAKLDIDIPPSVLVEQVCTTVRQAWINYEWGSLQLGPEPVVLPTPRPPKDVYMDRLFKATTRLAIGEICMGFAMDTAIDGVTKEELGAFAKGRTETLALAEELPG